LLHHLSFGTYGGDNYRYKEGQNDHLENLHKRCSSAGLAGTYYVIAVAAVRFSDFSTFAQE